MMDGVEQNPTETGEATTRAEASSVLLASPRGFCAGVDRAIEIVDRALEIYGPPVYVLHEIVHNRSVLEDFRGRGVRFVEGLDEVRRVFKLPEPPRIWLLRGGW